MTAMGLKKPSAGFIQPPEGDLGALNNAQIEVRPSRRCRWPGAFPLFLRLFRAYPEAYLAVKPSCYPCALPADRCPRPLRPFHSCSGLTTGCGTRRKL